MRGNYRLGDSLVNLVKFYLKSADEQTVQAHRLRRDGRVK